VDANTAKEKTMQEHGEGSSDEVRMSPVDNYTYDLLQALTSKLEAIEAYGMYAEDEEGGSGLFEQLAMQEREHAERLLAALRERLAR
jgi:rubrerythrin